MKTIPALSGEPSFYKKSIIINININNIFFDLVVSIGSSDNRFRQKKGPSTFTCRILFIDLALARPIFLDLIRNIQH